MARVFEPGVPLSHYLRDHPDVGVRFHCARCMAYSDVPIARVVGRLKARAIGDEETGIREVGRLSTNPCGRCGAVAWETMPAFPSRRPE